MTGVTQLASDVLTAALSPSMGGPKSGATITAASRFVVSLAILIAANSAVLAAPRSAADQVDATAPINILAISSYSQDVPWQQNFERGLKAGLSGKPNQYRVSWEYLDAGRIGDDDYLGAFERYLETKYRTTRIDVLLTESRPAMLFLRDHPDLLPDAKHLLVRPGEVSEFKRKDAGASIILIDDFSAAIAEMRRLVHPKKTYVVADASSPSQELRVKTFRAVLERDYPDLEVEYLIDLPMEELLAKVAKLPEGSTIFYLLILQDGTGRSFVPYQAAQRIAERANAPMFSNWNSLMGSGIVGGYMLSGERTGEFAATWAAALALNEDFDAGDENGYGYFYDWRQLGRWNIDEKLLPADATILFKHPTFFDAYRRQIIGTFAVLAALACLSVALLFLNRKLQKADTIINAAFGNMPLGVIMVDRDARLVIANHRYGEMFSLPPELLKVGTPWRDQVRYWTSIDGFFKPEERDVGSRQLMSVGQLTGPVATVYELADGRTYNIRFEPLEGGGWVAITEDLTERRAIEVHAEEMKRIDLLTGLPNRLWLLEHLAKLRNDETPEQPIALLVVNLDRFQSINDALGPAIGDKILLTLVQRLKEVMRGTDLLAHLGGDHFSIVQAGTVQPQGASALAERVLGVLSVPYQINGRRVTVGASVGIAIGSRDRIDAEGLLKNSDIALRHAKSDGGGAFRLFEPEMAASSLERHTLENDLRTALERRQFEIHYQPEVNLETGAISTFEALLRWRHPERGLISPAEFIPIAEQAGLITTIGAWVLKQACSDATHWPAHVKVAVNLSPLQLNSPQILRSVDDALAVSGLAPNRLQLEVTESVLLEQTETNVSHLNQLKARGLDIAIDDFGTGFSGLSYFQMFRFDKIKIDQRFVGTITDDSSTLAIFRSIISLAASMGIATTAEGVETTEQLERVRAEGCTEVQGWFTGRPMPIDHATALLAEPTAAGRFGRETALPKKA